MGVIPKSKWKQSETPQKQEDLDFTVTSSNLDEAEDPKNIEKVFKF